MDNKKKNIFMICYNYIGGNFQVSLPELQQVIRVMNLDNLLEISIKKGKENNLPVQDIRALIKNSLEDVIGLYNESSEELIDSIDFDELDENENYDGQYEYLFVKLWLDNTYVLSTDQSGKLTYDSKEEIDNVLIEKINKDIKTKHKTIPENAEVICFCIDLVDTRFPLGIFDSDEMQL
jgi:hypothetical protein